MLDVETDAYIHCVSAFVKLAQSEYQLLVEVIPEHHQKKTFDSLIQVLPRPVRALQSCHRSRAGPVSVATSSPASWHLSWRCVWSAPPIRSALPPLTPPGAPTAPGSQLSPLPPKPCPHPQDALEGLMLEGENIVSAARKAIVRHDFSAVLAIFPILRHLKQTKPEFDQVLQVRGRRGAWGHGEEGAEASPGGGQGNSWKEGAARPPAAAGTVAAVPLCAAQGTAASTKNKLPGLITSMETVGAKALEDFADNIKVISLLPPQGRLAVGRGQAPSGSGLPEG